MYIFTEHHCGYPGCGLVMVIDGNQKIRRSVCMATDAGSIEYPSLPGSIKIGCTRSPKFKSRFCEQHEPRSYSGNPQHLSESHIEKLSPTKHHPLQSEGQIVELLLEKKSTRNGTYYKVCMCLCAIICDQICKRGFICAFIILEIQIQY